MDFIERVTAVFAESNALNARAAATQAGAIDAAARSIVTSLLNGGTVLSCGSGCSAADAQYFAAQMQHRFEMERPGLPVKALNSNTAIGADDGFGAVFAKQIGVLGHPGDVLFAMHAGNGPDNIVPAIEAASDRQTRVDALTGRDAGDIEIRTPAGALPRVLENHRLVIHCLCDLIDLQLLGG